jgi:RNA polymerase sigma factor (sigma-70 family)
MDAAAAPGAAVHPPGLALRMLRDEKLAAMVAEGNDDAFATLYRRHHQDVYRYCLSLLRSEADARDALQSSMLAALSALRARGIEGAFKPWLFRIAHNESISVIRGRAHEAPSEAPPTAASSDDRDTREQLRTLVSDLAALPARQRGAIVMRELSGLSYAEIAAALNTSEAGGKQLVYEARTALQDLQAGHEMSCDLVRERISARDRRLLRGRKVRSHLRGCQPCQDFERAIEHRRRGLPLLAPPLAPLAAAALLEQVFGVGGGGTGTGVATSGAAGASGVGSGGLSVAGPAALKVAATVLIMGGAGYGTYEGASALLGGSAAPTLAAAEQRAGATGQRGDHGASQPGHAGSERGTGGAAEKGPEPGKPDGHGAGSQGGKPDASGPASATDAGGPGDSTGGGSSDGGGSGDSSGPGPSPDPPPPSGGGGGGGPTPPPPGGGGGGPTPPPPGGGGGGPTPPPPGGGGGSTVPPGTPPGHGGTPPGQGGTPPGQAGGGTPPGQLGNPGHGHG